jgi:hypothetical protein
MANSPNYPNSVKQPQPRIIPNDPQPTVAAALASNKKQVDQSK